MRRIQAAFFALAALALALPVAAVAADDAATVDAAPKVLGDADAPVTIIEYASMSCPHCARFHATDLPWLKETYIDTGRAKLEFRDFPLNAPALWGAMLAHCGAGGDSDRYFAWVDILFERQREWAAADDTQAALADIARQRGVGTAKFQACMADEALQEAVIRSRMVGVEEFAVDSTPSFVIDGELVGGSSTREALAERIEAAGD